MKKLLLLFALATAYLLYSCGQQNKVPLLGYLTPKNLPSQSFTIDITKDTALTTVDGIKIKIPANSIQSKSSTVTLEVKEALSIGEMLKAGLTTRSDKGILRSDGMFYINTKEEASIVKPISIDVPTSYADSSMQLYKGKEGKDGAINWENPEALQTTADPGVESGGAFFRTNCASCHSIEKKLTGPALGWVTKRRSMKWLKEFTKNSAAVLASDDPYSCCIFTSYAKLQMTPFPNLSDLDINNIYRYIEHESARLKLPENIGATCCDESQKQDEQMMELLIKRERIAESGKVVDTLDNNIEYDFIVSGPDSAKTIGAPIATTKVSSSYYSFTITSFGWYNVDALIANNDNKSELKVRLANVDSKQVNMYMVIPSLKVCAAGGILADNNYWGFYTLDGNIFLPQNVDAYVIVVGEEDGKTFFGSKHFITSRKQLLEVPVTNMDKNSIVRVLASLRFTQLTFEDNRSSTVAIAADSVNELDATYYDTTKIPAVDTRSSELKMLDKKIDSLNKRRTGCPCFEPMPITASDSVSRK